VDEFREMAAGLDARGSTDREKGSPTGAWLADAAGIPKGVARRQVNVAKKLRVLPLVDAALMDGRISAHHAGVLANASNRRVVNAVAEAQEALLGLVQAEAHVETGAGSLSTWTRPRPHGPRSPWSRSPANPRRPSPRVTRPGPPA